MRTPGSSGGGPGLVLPAILVLLGFMVSVAFVQERLREEELPTRAGELEALVRTRQATIRDLVAEADSLSDGLAEAQRMEARESELVARVVEQLDRLRPPSGLGAVRGPGLVVELADSPDAPSTRAEVTDLRIQDVDLQLVVNALWAAGAEAVAVGGRRVISTTAIRKAGDSILVNFGAVSSPYLVTAIGDAEALERGVAGSEIARQFAVWEQVYGLGFAIRGAEEVTVPALQGTRDLEWAVPAGHGT